MEEKDTLKKHAGSGQEKINNQKEDRESNQRMRREERRESVREEIRKEDFYKVKIERLKKGEKKRTRRKR